MGNEYEIIESGDQQLQATKACPFCGETILDVAKKCKHCRETLDVVLRSGEEAFRAKNQHQQINVNQNVQTPIHVMQRRNFPHGWHFLFTILTMGMWAIVWFLHYIFRDRSKYW